MQPEVKTTAGKVRGRTADGVASFLGIPYAAAPSGPNRFATTGDPGWEPYGQERSVRRFGTAVETVRDPRGDTRALWEGIR